MVKVDVLPVATERYDIQTPDFPTVMAKVKASAPDALICYLQNPSLSVAAIKAAAQTFPGIPVLGSYTMLRTEAVKAAGAAAEGMYTMLGFSPESERPQLKTFLSGYQAAYGTPPNIEESGWAYDSVRVVGEIAAAGVTDPDRMISRVHNLSNWPGVFDDYAPDDEGNMLHAVWISQVKGGAFKLVRRAEG